MDRAVKCGNKRPILADDGDCRVNSAERCAEDTHPAVRDMRIHQAGPRAGEKFSRGAILFRPQMAGGDSGEINLYRLWRVINPQTHTLFIHSQVGDFAGFMDLYVKIGLPCFTQDG